jgi:hypothetical protein
LGCSKNRFLKPGLALALFFWTLVLRTRVGPQFSKPAVSGPTVVLKEKLQVKERTTGCPSFSEVFEIIGTDKSLILRVFKEPQADSSLKFQGTSQH